MNSFNALMDGFAGALTLNNLLFGLLGTVLGTLVGVLPGIGPALAIALLLPITYTVSPASALIMLPLFTTVRCTGDLQLQFY